MNTCVVAGSMAHGAVSCAASRPHIFAPCLNRRASHLSARRRGASWRLDGARLMVTVRGASHVDLVRGGAVGGAGGHGLEGGVPARRRLAMGGGVLDVRDPEAPRLVVPVARVADEVPRPHPREGDGDELAPRVPAQLLHAEHRPPRVHDHHLEAELEGGHEDEPGVLEDAREEVVLPLDLAHAELVGQRLQDHHAKGDGAVESLLVRVQVLEDGGGHGGDHDEGGGLEEALGDDVFLHDLPHQGRVFVDGPALQQRLRRGVRRQRQRPQRVLH
mmetsp:Transcript_26382/g.57290  ORF Transcript_26382/g.57290 Transcript_26382/m.57290 type:complete len:274 (-) Transcript_26382:2741-3562(-)